MQQHFQENMPSFWVVSKQQILWFKQRQPQQQHQQQPQPQPQRQLYNVEFKDFKRFLLPLFFSGQRAKAGHTVLFYIISFISQQDPNQSSTLIHNRIYIYNLIDYNRYLTYKRVASSCQIHSINQYEYDPKQWWSLVGNFAGMVRLVYEWVSWVNDRLTGRSHDDSKRQKRWM